MTATATAPQTQVPGTPRMARVSTMLGCLQALVVANLVQVAAAFAGVEPSPPSAVVPGIAATAVLGLAAIPLVRDSVRLGYGLGIAFCLASMIGMGPHKLLLDDGGVIAPLALVGFALEVLFIVHATRALRSTR
jgi:hypothetical protein